MQQIARAKNGFSLIELVVVLAIAGVIAVAAVPSVGVFVSTNRIAAVSNGLVYSVQTARSEAVERLLPTGVCTSNDPMHSDAGCNQGAGYQSGWIVYVDTNRNGSRETGEPVVHRQKPPGTGFTITTQTVFADQIYFNDSGNSINVAGIPLSGTISIEYAEREREVTVSANGRVSTETP